MNGFKLLFGSNEVVGPFPNYGLHLDTFWDSLDGNSGSKDKKNFPFKDVLLSGFLQMLKMPQFDEFIKIYCFEPLYAMSMTFDVYYTQSQPNTLCSLHSDDGWTDCLQICCWFISVSAAVVVLVVVRN